MKATSIVTMPLSTLYDGITRLRRAAYRTGVFSTTKLSAPVISVGNITTGGTGKTPLVEWVCRTIFEISSGDAAEAKRPNICVLTRGYGRVDPETQVVVSDGNKLLAASREAGDEPLLLAKNLLGIAAVVCNRDRVAAGEWAKQSLGAEVFVLDDAFQHLRVARDLDIVAVDATNPWAGGSLLPEGRLRERLDNLARANCIVVTRCDQVEDLAAIKTELERLATNVPVFSSRMSVAGIRNLNGDGVDQAELLPKPILAFCGVGNPEAFFNQLRLEGFSIIGTRAFRDHHSYTQSDCDRLADEAKANGAALMTTAKDAIKLEALRFEVPCYVLDIRIAIDEEENLVELIRNTVWT